MGVRGPETSGAGNMTTTYCFNPNRNREEWPIAPGPHRKQLGLRNHLPQGPGQPVPDGGRLRRRLRSLSAEMRNRWLYTAITRAERGLLILS
jgi:hypothetical protein